MPIKMMLADKYSSKGYVIKHFMQLFQSFKSSKYEFRKTFFSALRWRKKIFVPQNFKTSLHTVVSDVCRSVCQSGAAHPFDYTQKYNRFPSIVLFKSFV